jgi:hypothetical protein
MPTDSFVQIQPDSTGKKIDTVTLDNGNYRQTVTLGDSANNAQVATVNANNELQTHDASVLVATQNTAALLLATNTSLGTINTLANSVLVATQNTAALVLAVNTSVTNVSIQTANVAALVLATNTSLGTINTLANSVLVATQNTAAQIANVAARIANSSTPDYVVGYITVSANSFTRPNNNTAYALAEVVASSTTNTSCGALSFSPARVASGTYVVRRARLVTSANSTANANFRLHFFNANVTYTNGDGGTWLTTGSNNYVGSMDVTLTQAFTDGAVGFGTSNQGSELNYAPGANSLYVVIEARNSYVPANSGVFSVSLEIYPN